jgi:hypothetical protein
MRLFPHLQDTGGFFICVLKKVAPCPTKTEGKNAGKNTEASNDANEPNITEENMKIDEKPNEANEQQDEAKKKQQEERNEKRKAKRGGGTGYPGAKGYEWKEDPFYAHTEALDDFYALFGIDQSV